MFCDVGKTEWSKVQDNDNIRGGRGKKDLLWLRSSNSTNLHHTPISEGYILVSLG